MKNFNWKLNLNKIEEDGGFGSVKIFCAYINTNKPLSKLHQSDANDSNMYMIEYHDTNTIRGTSLGYIDQKYLIKINKTKKNGKRKKKLKARKGTPRKK